MKNLFVYLFLDRALLKGQNIKKFTYISKSQLKIFSASNDANAITIFFRRQAEKSQGLLRIKLQKLTFCRNASNNNLKIIIKLISYNRLEYAKNLYKSFIQRIGMVAIPSKKNQTISNCSNVKFGIFFISIFFLKISLSAGDCVQGDCINGEGTMKFANGDSYTGTFKDEKKIGYGIYTFSNGERYEGEFQSDFPNGKGTAFLANGNVYTGYFINNVPDGKGKMVFSNGNIYDGEWKRGVREGKGTMSYVDGSTYTGEWKANKKSGYGTFKKSIVVGIQTPSMPMPTRPLRKVNESQFWITKIQN